MLSQNNEYLKEASETVYHLTQEKKVRLQCQAREDYYRRMKSIQEKFEQLKQYKAEIKQYEAQKAQSDAEIADPKQQIAVLKKELEAKSRVTPCFLLPLQKRKGRKIRPLLHNSSLQFYSYRNYCNKESTP